MPVGFKTTPGDCFFFNPGGDTCTLPANFFAGLFLNLLVVAGGAKEGDLFTGTWVV
jgi:hypothetical protein